MNSSTVYLYDAFLEIDTVGNFSNFHIGLLSNGIRAIIVVKAKWKPLKLHAPPIGKDGIAIAG